MQFDVDAIKSAGRGCWGAVVCTLANFPREHFDGGYHPCPKCGGKDRFRFSNVDGSGSTICSQCGKNGDGIATVMWALGVDFNEACRILMKELRITKESTTGHATSGDLQQTKPQPQPATRKPEKDPSANIAPLEIRPHQAHILLSLWAATHKPGISPNSITDNGGCLATYKPNPKYSGFQVVAIPAYDSRFPGSQPCGWAMYQRDGSEFKVNNQPCKVKQTDGSRGGLFGLHALKILSDPATRKKIQVVFKVEGLSDFLSLYSKIPPELRDTHLVISNSCGATENPYAWALDLLAGLTVYVVHDCDEPGQQGATWHAGKPKAKRIPGWCPALAVGCEQVRNVALPYPITKSDGKDLRDWLNDGGDLAGLMKLGSDADRWTEKAELPAPSIAKSATPATETAIATAPVIGYEVPPLKALDPMPEARIFLKGFLTNPDTENESLRLRNHCGEFLIWLDQNRHYRPMIEGDIRSMLVRYLSLIATKIENRAVGNIFTCVKAESMIDSTLSCPAWIDGHPSAELFPAHEILPTRNSLIHVPSLVAGLPCLTPATPSFFSRGCLDYEYDASAPIPEAWLEFLYQLWPNDQESQDLLQQWFGYCLLPDTSQQKILMMIGPRRSGKGTIARIMRAVIGESNFTGPTMSDLASQYGLWPLIGKNLAIIADARVSAKMDIAQVVERLLSISGEDSLTIPRKYLPSVTMKLPTRFAILSNEIPKLGDSSGALSGRTLILRFTKSFYGQEDHTLTDRLQKELPGILNWALLGWMQLRDNGRFTQPDSGKPLVQEMEDLSSEVGQFVREHCIISDEQFVPVDDLFDKWKSFCEEIGKKESGTKNIFGRNLRAVVPNLEIKQKRDGMDRYREFRGVGLIH